MENKLWGKFESTGCINTYLNYKSSINNKQDDEKSYDDNKGENLVIE